MSILSIIPAIVGLIDKALDKTIEDKDEKARLTAEITKSLYEHQQFMVDAMTKVALAEMKGESWLQRNWRPMIMIWFALLTGMYWVGLTPENLPPEAINGLLDIVLASVSIYAAGRSGEKITKTWAAAKKVEAPPPTSVSGPGGIF